MEIVNSRKSNIIVVCLYKHPNMDFFDFNENYLNILFDILSKENQQVFHLREQVFLLGLAQLDSGIFCL